MLPVRQLAARALGARGWPWASALCGDRLLQTSTEYHATTILVVRKDGHVCMIGDGQVSIGAMVAKPNANKLRRIGDTVIAGFAGSAADGLSLLERLENKLEEHPGQLMRACVELAKMWRQDKAMRFLEAQLLVADASITLTVSGNGDVLEPQDGVMGIGSGSPYAVAAARALLDIHGMDASSIAAKSMKIASDMCVYTNANFSTQTIAAPPVTPA
ncbi:ATP-dependent protease peptidase subunit [Haematococcus lacustris]|uniref:Peptidase subunit of mitochondrial ATP-dependent protease hslUV n=1 Tax=Haematococcus lacustris TaxID=44745 RepID=A0A6A0AGA4_HAELA|nr:peptidase subunit of mitochondrial ATP-dependent protease hslUV [Haematococcus lacustris]